MKIYQRTENGKVTEVSVKDGLTEINHAMMAGKGDVAEMSSISRTNYTIKYKDGRSVTLVRAETAPAEHVVHVRTGAVHIKSGYTEPGRVFAQCKVLPRSQYEITADTITCEDCKEQERRALT